MTDYDEYLDGIKTELQAGRRQWKRGDKILDAFGYKRRRSAAIELINNSLRAKGMFTAPELTTSMPLDRAIRFYLVGAEVEEPATQDAQAADSGPIEMLAMASRGDDAEDRSPISVAIPEEPPAANEEAPGALSLIVGNLKCSENPPLGINPSESIKKALTLMALWDYSQLVVTAGDRNIRGIISYKSVAQAFLQRQPKTVSDCLDRAVPVVNRDEPLLNVIERFDDYDVVLVKGPDQRLAGIVTPADIAKEFAEMAAPFFLIGVIEEQLRWLVNGIPDLTTALAAAPSSAEQSAPRSIVDLTMGDLHRILRKEDNWEKVGINFDQTVFCQELDSVREIRNAVMHFRELPADATERVKKFAGIVQTAYLSAVHSRRVP